MTDDVLDRPSEREFHDCLVDDLYDLAMQRAQARWPAAVGIVHEQMATRALTAALMRAEAVRRGQHDA